MKNSILATLVSLQLLATATMSSGHATHLTQLETLRETVYVPNCSSDESRQQWFNCLADHDRSGRTGDLYDRR